LSISKKRFSFFIGIVKGEALLEKAFIQKILFVFLKAAQPLEFNGRLVNSLCFVEGIFFIGLLKGEALS
jgi:hypothetical protein